MGIEMRPARSIFMECVVCEDHEERESLIADRCDGNKQLLSEVRELLAGHEENDGFLEQPFDDLLAVGDVDPSAIATSLTPPIVMMDLVGSRIGPYKLLQEIGEGGFGVVYMAEQIEPVRRKVALKIIKPGMDTKEVIARFEAERQALALMDHPNIAKVFDAGGTESGRPYFVMELVHGVPITEFCDEQKLSTRERLTLFLSICRALQHAHQKGIIHRDLKPSNIMISMDGDRALAKVIDFGISKALSQQLTDRTLFTAYGQMIGTPMYMSPEQAQFSVHDIDTRSDVYSLGVLMYELLTGNTPFNKETLQKSGIDELRRIIREIDPPHPSASLQTLPLEKVSTLSEKRSIPAAHLVNSLRGELDWIIMKCLEKDRARRYESVSALSEDIEHYLNDEKVNACPPSLAYQAKKLFRRHRFAIGTVIGVFAVMILGIVGLAIANFQIANEQSKTQAALGQANAEKDRAENHFAQSLEITNELLDQIDEWNLSEQPKMQKYHRDLLVVADRALQDLMNSAPDDLRPLEVRTRVVFELSGAQHWLGDLESAEAYARETLSLLEKVLKLSAEPQSTRRWRRLKLDTHYAYGWVLRSLNRHAESAKQFAQAIEIQKSLYTDESSTGKATLYNLIGALASEEEAQGLHDRARRLRYDQMKIFGIDVDEQLQLKDDISKIRDSMNELPEENRPVFFEDLADWQTDLKTESRLRKELVQYRRDHVSKNPSRSLSYSLAEALRDYGITEARQKNWSAAIDSLREAYNMYADLATDYPDLEKYSERRDLAERTYRKAVLATAESLAPEESLSVLNDSLKILPEDPAIYKQRGQLYKNKLNKPELAQADFDRVMKLKPDDAQAYFVRSTLFKELGYIDAALEDLSKAIEIDESAELYFARGEIYLDQAEVEKARMDFQKVAELQPNYYRIHQSIGDCYRLERDWEHALEEYSKEISLRSFPNAFAFNWSVRAQFQLGKYKDALTSIRSGIKYSPSGLYSLVVVGERDMLACPDPTFRSSLLELADLGVETWSEKWYASIIRGHLKAHFGDLDEALADYQAGIEATRNLGERAQHYNNSSWFLATSPQTQERHLTKAKAWAKKAIELQEHSKFPAALYHKSKPYNLMDFLPHLGPYRARGMLYTVLGMDDLANADFANSRPWEEESCQSYYQFALVALAMGKKGHYRDTCHRMLHRFSETTDPEEAYLTVWTLSLGENSVEDYQPAFKLARSVIKTDPLNRQMQIALGALRYRAGAMDDAREILESAMESSLDGQQPSPDVQLLLGMACHQLQDEHSAKSNLDDAITAFERELNDSMHWSRFFTWKLLQEEAVELIKNATYGRG